MQGLGKTLRYPVWFAGRVPLERLTMQAVLDNSNEEWLDRLAENLARREAALDDVLECRPEKAVTDASAGIGSARDAGILRRLNQTSGAGDRERGLRHPDNQTSGTKDSKHEIVVL